MSDINERDERGIAPDDPGLEDTVADFEVEEEAPAPEPSGFAVLDEQVEGRARRVGAVGVEPVMALIGIEAAFGLTRPDHAVAAEPKPLR